MVWIFNVHISDNQDAIQDISNICLSSKTFKGLFSFSYIRIIDGNTAKTCTNFDVGKVFKLLLGQQTLQNQCPFKEK